MNQEKILQYAAGFCLDAIEYYNKLAEDNINNPLEREKYLSWSQSKQADLIAIQEIQESPVKLRGINFYK